VALLGEAYHRYDAGCLKLIGGFGINKKGVIQNGLVSLPPAHRQARIFATNGNKQALPPIKRLVPLPDSITLSLRGRVICPGATC